MHLFSDGAVRIDLAIFQHHQRAHEAALVSSCLDVIILPFGDPSALPVTHLSRAFGAAVEVTGVQERTFVCDGPVVLEPSS